MFSTKLIDKIYQQISFKILKLWKDPVVWNFGLIRGIEQLSRWADCEKWCLVLFGTVSFHLKDFKFYQETLENLLKLLTWGIVVCTQRWSDRPKEQFKMILKYERCQIDLFTYKVACG